MSGALERLIIEAQKYGGGVVFAQDRVPLHRDSVTAVPDFEMVKGIVRNTQALESKGILIDYSRSASGHLQLALPGPGQDWSDLYGLVLGAPGNYFDRFDPVRALFETGQVQVTLGLAEQKLLVYGPGAPVFYGGQAPTATHASNEFERLLQAIHCKRQCEFVNNELQLEPVPDGVLPPDHLENQAMLCLLLIPACQRDITLEALVPLQTQLLKWKGWVDVEVAEHLGIPRLQLTFKRPDPFPVAGTRRFPRKFSALIAEINVVKLRFLPMPQRCPLF